MEVNQNLTNLHGKIFHSAAYDSKLIYNEKKIITIEAEKLVHFQLRKGRTAQNSNGNHVGFK